MATIPTLQVRKGVDAITNPFSKDYIQKIIKDQIRIRKISALNAYIRKLVPKYILSDELKDKISKLVDERK